MNTGHLNTELEELTGNGSLNLDTLSFIDDEGEKTVPPSPESAFGDDYIRLEKTSNKASGESDQKDIAKEVISDQPLTRASTS